MISIKKTRMFYTILGIIISLISFILMFIHGIDLIFLYLKYCILLLILMRISLSYHLKIKHPNTIKMAGGDSLWFEFFFKDEPLHLTNNYIINFVFIYRLLKFFLIANFVSLIIIILIKFFILKNVSNI